MTAPVLRFEDPQKCAEAALDLATKSHKKHILMSGGLAPSASHLILQLLGAHNLETNDFDPDPLGFEDLVSGIGPHLAAVIVQNPSYFGTLRDFTALRSECREWQVPLLEITAPATPATPDWVEATQSLARQVAQIRGVRVITDRFVCGFSLYLGDDVDGADVLEHLQRLGIGQCEAVALAYPSYPELRPVLIVHSPQDAAQFCPALREALALVHKSR